MPRLFLGNFQFEHELAEGAIRSTKQLRTIETRLAACWMTIARDHDLIWSPSDSNSKSQADGTDEFQSVSITQIWNAPQVRFVSNLDEVDSNESVELIPWGWSPSVLSLGLDQGWHCPAPPLDAVRLVNSRAYRWQLESQLGIAVPGSMVFDSEDELVTHLNRWGGHFQGWVLKANYGMSGRERLLVHGTRLTDPNLNWIRKRLAQSGAIVLEPWLDRVDECGLQWEIPPQGKPILLAALPLLTDRSGAYRGSTLSSEFVHSTEWLEAIEIGREVALRVQQTGYFGPLGLDAMRYRNERGQVALRPLQDLNARYTMGRLACGLLQYIKPDETGVWLHDRKRVMQIHNESPHTRIASITDGSWLITQYSG